jgi:hypothetical protein
MGKGIVHKLGYKYIEGAAKNAKAEVKNAYVLNDEQKKKIKSISLETYFWSALIGAVAVMIVVLPMNIWPNLFGIQKFNLFGTHIEFELYYTIFGILMLFPEIWALNFVNLRAVRNIAKVCNYPNQSLNDFGEQIELLTEAGLEMPAKHLALFNIDPYIGLSKFSYYSLFILAKLKATLSNIVVKLLVKRFLGRYALRIVTDLAGIPIFAFWNAWASRQVIKETKMRLMASGATEDFLEDITDEELKSVEHKIGPLFHFIAQQKRNYNFALYAYMKEVIRRVPETHLENKKEIKLDELFADNNEENILIAKMLVFGLMVDGSLSIREKITLKKLGDKEWFPYDLDQLEAAVKRYSDGFGLVAL